MRIRSMFFCVAALICAACGRPTAGPSPKTSFQCDDIAVSAEFPDQDTERVTVAGQVLTLRRAEAASGAKYSDAAGNEFWVKDGALLTLAGQAMRHCTQAGGTG